MYRPGVAQLGQMSWPPPPPTSPFSILYEYIYWGFKSPTVLFSRSLVTAIRAVFFGDVTKKPVFGLSFHRAKQMRRYYLSTHFKAIALIYYRAWNEERLCAIHNFRCNFVTRIYQFKDKKATSLLLGLLDGSRQEPILSSPLLITSIVINHHLILSSFLSACLTILFKLLETKNKKARKFTKCRL